MNETTEGYSFFKALRSVGPTIIVACLVLGPGSILINSKIGWQLGYSAGWVLLCAVLLMIVMVTLAMRLGVALKQSVCDELAESLGRWYAVLIGICLFLIAACFQFSNNLGVLFGIEPLLGNATENIATWVIIALNVVLILFVATSARLYQHVESVMKWLMGLMLISFLINLLIVRPSIYSAIEGLIPSSLGIGTENSADLMLLSGLVATTFSVAAAFYQTYLVRQKDWSSSDLATSSTDSLVGVAALGLLSWMIMLTSAAALHGNPEVTKLQTAADVAKQLEPLFGTAATWLFAIGILAGALSSFLVNAMIGGCVASDGLGFGSNANQIGPKIGTILGLLTGMFVALAVQGAEFDTSNLIVFAQSVTVIGNPLLAGSMIWLASRRRFRETGLFPTWLLVSSSIGFIVVLILSLRTIAKLTGLIG